MSLVLGGFRNLVLGTVLLGRGLVPFEIWIYIRALGKKYNSWYMQGHLAVGVLVISYRKRIKQTL
jgi:hypothetical protein